METIPTVVLNGLTLGGGVSLFFFALMRGWIVTKREADVYIARAEKAEGRIDELTQQNSELLSFARLGKSTFKALRENAAAGELAEEDA